MTTKNPEKNIVTIILEEHIKDFVRQWRIASGHAHIARTLIHFIKEGMEEIPKQESQILESLIINMRKLNPGTQFHWWQINKLQNTQSIMESFLYLCLGDCPHVIPTILEIAAEKRTKFDDPNIFQTLSGFFIKMSPLNQYPPITIEDGKVKISDEEQPILQKQMKLHLELLQQIGEMQKAY
jgi:hypothetical protein